MDTKENAMLIEDIEPRADVMFAQRFQQFLGGAPMPADTETRKWLFWLWVEDMCGQNNE